MTSIKRFCTIVAIAASPSPAFSQTTLVLVRQLSHIEHLSLLDLLWKTLDPKTEQILVAEQSWPELKAPARFIGDPKVVHFSNGGFEDQGAIAAPAGYTVCHASMKEPSVTCNGSLTARYRTTSDPDGEKIDGLHYTIAYSKSTPAATQPPPGRCWISGYLMVTFVVSNERSRFKCGDTGSIAFEYPGSGGKSGASTK
jgi:hypothetical protein